VHRVCVSSRDIARGRQKSGAPVDDDLGGPADVRGNDGNASGDRLDRDAWEAFPARRHEQHVDRAVDQLDVFAQPEQAHVTREACIVERALDRGLQRTVTRDREDHVAPLVDDPARDAHEVERCLRIRERHDAADHPRVACDPEPLARRGAVDVPEARELDSGTDQPVRTRRADASRDTIGDQRSRDRDHRAGSRCDRALAGSRDSIEPSRCRVE
jgi:hypothetical protein